MNLRFNWKSHLRSRSGQILVEYVLLMVIAVSCATLLTKALVGRGDGGTSSQGLIIKKWDQILKTIGNDLPECSKQTNFNSPNCPP